MIYMIEDLFNFTMNSLKVFFAKLLSLFSEVNVENLKEETKDEKWTSNLIENYRKINRVISYHLLQDIFFECNSNRNIKELNEIAENFLNDNMNNKIIIRTKILLLNEIISERIAENEQMKVINNKNIERSMQKNIDFRIIRKAIRAFKMRQSTHEYFIQILQQISEKYSAAVNEPYRWSNKNETTEVDLCELITYVESSILQHNKEKWKIIKNDSTENETKETYEQKMKDIVNKKLDYIVENSKYLTVKQIRYMSFYIFYI